MGKFKKGLSDKVRKSQASKARNVFQVKNNPFEVKINKQKHKILGRKSKHDRGLPGVSRSKANKKRKDTLLKEYKERHRSNNVMDERFGEDIMDMSIEEKMLKRFAMEKKKKHEKMSKFNLNDDEEELTHFGQSIADIKDFGISTVSDDEDNGVISGEYVAEAHFGGGIFTKKDSEQNPDEERRKTKKEIMDEIICKSKKAKFDKQKAQEQSMALTEKLDNAWAEIEMLLRSSSKTKKDREEEKQRHKADAYDLVVKQMQYDKKAAPAPRGKTDAEKAAEEVARIRKLEDERIRRMQETCAKSEASKHRSPDELNNEYMPEKIDVEPVSYKDGVMVGAELPADDGDDKTNWQLEVDLDQDSDDENDADMTLNPPDEERSEDEQTDDDDDDDDDDNDNDDFSDILSVDDEEISETTVPDKDDDSGNVSLDTEIAATSTRKTDNFPLTYDEFTVLLEKKYHKDCVKCISELHAKYPLAAAAGNKNRLKKLYEYTWNILQEQFSAEIPNMACVDGLVIILYELCQLNTLDCAKYVVKCLRESYQSHLRAEGRLSMPSLGHLMQFKLVKILFSTSDFSHPVCTPALLFMSNIVKAHRPTNLRDLASGLFICTLIYEYVSFSKRFVPECINYLCAALCLSVPKTVQKSKGIPASASLHLTAKNCELLVLESNENSSDGVVDKLDLVRLLSTNRGNVPNHDIMRIQLLQITIRLIVKFILIYGNLPCFKEIFNPIRVACTRCAVGYRQRNNNQADYPCANLLSEIQVEMHRVITRRSNLTPLVQIESNRPTALRLYEPQIEPVGEPFRKGSGKNVSASKREMERLQHKYKRELKGAVREVKKDARFLAKEKLNEQIQKDQERAAKVKRLFGFLSNQEGEVKKINRKKFKLDVS